MTFILNSDNAFDYLRTQGLLDKYQQPPTKIEPLAAKNFNLLLTFTEKHKLLIKQERLNKKGVAAGELIIEWRIQEFLRRFPELQKYRQFLAEVLHFDVENSIIVCRYLDDYRDLTDFYGKEKSFPTEIAIAIGNILATIHRDTFEHPEYQEFFTQDSVNFHLVSNLIRGFERVEPEIFGLVTDDALKFFALYQRYDSLGQAIAQLGESVKPACLTHNDLKLNNILVRNNWQDSDHIIRLIDWERSHWGDPAFDLGTIIGSYIQIWLGSLVISTSLTIEESLRLAITPLEMVQPSIAALTQSYLNTFPEIIQHRPDYLHRVVQFAGLALILHIESMIQYEKSFSNTGIAMLQVAKALLTRPVQSIPTIFGHTFNITAV